MGLYRVNYDHENWELLGNQLTHNHRVSRGQVEVALLCLSTRHAKILKQVVFALLVPSCQQVVFALLVPSRQQVVFALLVPSCQQVVFALLVPSCQQVWNNVLTIVTTLLILSEFLQGCSNKSDTVMIEQNCYNLVSSTFNILVIPCWNNLVTSLITPSSLFQVVTTVCFKLVTTTTYLWSQI
jgi:hypothetical protein